MKVRLRLCDDCFLKAVREGFDCEILSADVRGAICSACRQPRREAHLYATEVVAA